MSVRPSLGQYQVGVSPIHKLDARVKLVSTLLFMVSCFFVTRPASLVLPAVAVGAAVAASRIAPSTIARQVKPVVLFLLITSLMNLMFVRDGDLLFTLGPVSIFSGGVSAALLYTIRFALLLIAGALMMLTSTPTALMDAFQRVFSPFEHLGVPVAEAGLVLSIALRFVPTLAQEAQHVLSAQIARGADIEGKGALAYARACVPVIVPLFASALRHAEGLARALDARGYTGEERTHLHEPRIKKRDVVFVALASIYMAAVATMFFLG